MPEAAPRVFAVGAEHRGIDGAEHSAILFDVMAGDSPPQSTSTRGSCSSMTRAIPAAANLRPDHRLCTRHATWHVSVHVSAHAGALD